MRYCQIAYGWGDRKCFLDDIGIPDNLEYKQDLLIKATLFRRYKYRGEYNILKWYN